MKFFGMGLPEILIILIVGLVALGPGKMTRLARDLGKTIATFRKATTELTAEATREFENLAKEEKKPLKQKEHETDRPEAAKEH